MSQQETQEKGCQNDHHDDKTGSNNKPADTTSIQAERGSTEAGENHDVVVDEPEDVNSVENSLALPGFQNSSDSDEYVSADEGEGNEGNSMVEQNHHNGDGSSISSEDARDEYFTADEEDDAHEYGYHPQGNESDSGHGSSSDSGYGSSSDSGYGSSSDSGYGSSSDSGYGSSSDSGYGSSISNDSVENEDHPQAPAYVHCEGLLPENHVDGGSYDGDGEDSDAGSYAADTESNGGETEITLVTLGINQSLG